PYQLLPCTLCGFPYSWNSWNKFACDISEDLIKEMADAMVSTGLADAGYKYVNLDDCWQKRRNVRGIIEADGKRYVHIIYSTRSEDG
ncbi:glycoside hydrolase superfamily, partial [Endogone sp. FLAS-F59071]